MAQKFHSLVAVALLLAFISVGCQKDMPGQQAKARKNIVTSDTILSGMSESLLPSGFFEVSAILPPGQCPGHYDMKLSDIEKVKKADLVVLFSGMPFLSHANTGTGKQLLIDAKDRNWMAPHSYASGLIILANMFKERFPEYRQQIAARQARAIQETTEKEKALKNKLMLAHASARPIIASSMLREPLEWMGFQVVGEYGRQESISAKELAVLIRIGKEKKAVMIVDSLQSGPEAGKGIAEALAVPHVIISNFPLENGYAATLGANVDAVLAAAK
jgi:zinc transport system substrate-binding protein